MLGCSLLMKSGKTLAHDIICTSVTYADLVYDVTHMPTARCRMVALLTVFLCDLQKSPAVCLGLSNINCCVLVTFKH